MPDLQDQVAAAGILQQPDRRVGIDFDDLDRIRLAIDIDEHVDRGDAKPQRAGRAPRQDHGLPGRRVRHDHRAPRA
jgi:hypothetical protein